MDTEPVNPFQSPQAVDAPRKCQYDFNPSWLSLLVGLAIVPIGMPVSLVVQVFIGALVLGMEAPPPPNNLVGSIFVFPYVLTLFVGLPIVAYLRWSKRLTQAYVLTIGGILVAITTLLFLLVIVPKGYQENPKLGIRMLVLTACSVTSLFAPVALFALYLAFLRRRDQNRGGEPRG